jgi:Putative rhamnosyl transferase
MIGVSFYQNVYRNVEVVPAANHDWSSSSPSLHTTTATAMISSSKVSSSVPSPHSYYVPSIRNDVVKKDWDFGPVIHIVNSRYMQHQGNLTSLGNARLALFKVFCLPTMVQQSTQQFMWLIRVDPSMDSSLLRNLIDLVAHQNRSNIYIVASNANSASWRGGEVAWNLARCRVYSGNQTRLEIAMAVHNHYRIVETKLDMDDGLHKRNLQWLYWCAGRHVEWFWMDERIAKRGSIPLDMDASLQMDLLTRGSWHSVDNHHRFCATAGLSVAIGVGVPRSNVPFMFHTDLLKTIQGNNNGNNADNRGNSLDCGMPVQADCIAFVDDFGFEAIRSRTPTSAGVNEILNQLTTDQYTWETHQSLTTMALENFAVSTVALRWINSYISNRTAQLARDNLAGRCTPEHSCNENAKAMLQTFIPL